MARHQRLAAATLDRFGDLVDDAAGVQLRHLPPFTTLLVWTMNSLYRVVVADWPEVYIQGGAYFPEPTLAQLDGASLGGSCLRVGWIAAGFLVEIRSGGQRIVTSPVRAITTEQGSCSVVVVCGVAATEVMPGSRTK